MDALENTLKALMEEKNTLEDRLKNPKLKNKEDLQFELDIVSNNIKNVQGKIREHRL